MIDNKTLIQRAKVGRKEVILTVTTQEEILRVYRETHSMRQTAIRLQLAVRTVFKYVNRANASFHVGTPLMDDPLEQTNNRKIAKALDELNVPLPRDVAKIYDLLEGQFKLTAIHYFLKTRQRAAEEVLHNHGSLLTRKRLLLRDIYGRNIQVGSFSQYQLTVDRYNLNVTIEATLKFGGKVICRMAFAFYRDLLERHKPDLDNAPQRVTETSE